VKPGDFLVSIAGSIGKTILVPEDAPEMNCNQAVAIIRLNKAIYGRYLLHWFNSSDALKQISSGKVTATISNLSLGTIKELKILLPPLEEQKRIAAILDKADAIRKKRQQAIELADQFLKSVFLDMFGDPIINPYDFPIVPLGELIRFGPQNGLYEPSTKYGSGTPIIRIDSFGDGNITDIANLKRVDTSDENVARYSLSEQDIIINRVNSRSHLGKSALVEGLKENTVFESNMMRLVADSDLINPRFLVEMLQQRYIKHQILGRCKDSINQSSINQTDVKTLSFPLPPIQQQRKFEGVCRSFKAGKFLRLDAGLKHVALVEGLSQLAFKGGLTNTNVA
jgi:type I restriction enzyme S subunit